MDQYVELLTRSSPSADRPTRRPTRLHRPLILAASLLLTLLTCSIAQAAPKIVGGGSATQAWPAQGFLQITASDGTYLCGGSLVSERWFITAGHCVTDEETSVLLTAAAFKVTLGEANISHPAAADTYGVDKVVRDESYDPAIPDNDVALLHLSTAPSTMLEPLRLVPSTEPGLWGAGKTATIIGWGTTCASGCPTSNQLLQATAPIISDSACGLAYGTSFHAATMVCAGNGATDTCQGDSGGPLMVLRQGDYVLAGLTSWGFGCADAQFPGVYTRIGAPTLNQWIRNRIPTAAIAISPAAPTPGATVQLVASATAPADQTGSPTFTWDLDGDGAYDDQTGPNATLPSLAAGAYAVRVRATYPDGDVAPAREVVNVAAPAPAPPPPPPPVVTPPPPPPAPHAAVVAAPFAKLVDAPVRVSVKSLLDGHTSVKVSCSTACELSATLRLGGATARKIGLTPKKTGVQIGSGSADLSKAKTARVTIKLTKSAVRKLRAARGGSLALRVRATAGSRRLTLNQVQTLHR